MSLGAQVELRPASASEQQARDPATWPEWGARLSLPQYLKRELALRAHPWAREVMTTWLLVEGTQVLSSCETFRNHSSLGERDGATFAVASVFTEPALRGRGHGARLMEALVERLREEPDAHGSVLFSDVGAALYQRCGYRPVPAWDWVLPAAEAPTGPTEVEWLAPPVPPLPRRRAQEGQLVLHPSPQQLDWHFERSRLYARFLQRPGLSHWGARTAKATAWWTAQFKSDELLVLWLDAPDAVAAAALLRAAQSQAAQAGLPRVRLWETPHLAPLSGATRVPREGELPMVVGLGSTIDEWAWVERSLWV